MPGDCYHSCGFLVIASYPPTLRNSNNLQPKNKRINDSTVFYRLYYWTCLVHIHVSPTTTGCPCPGSLIYITTHTSKSTSSRSSDDPSTPIQLQFPHPTPPPPPPPPTPYWIQGWVCAIDWGKIDKLAFRYVFHLLNYLYLMKQFSMVMFLHPL